MPNICHWRRATMKSVPMPPDPTTERKGINAVEKIFLHEFSWLFREQPVSDYGIDAQVEVVENNKPTGKLIALQIKTGSRWYHPGLPAATLHSLHGLIFLSGERHLPR